MNKQNMTKFISSRDVKRERYLVDAKNKILGRLATKVATYLRGKHKAIFTPSADCGDHIVIVNAERVRVSGRKNKDKTYFTHSGHPQGDKLKSFEKMIEEKPEKVIQLAVAGMIPHNRLGKQVIKKLKIYTGERPEFAKLKKLEV